MTKRDIEREILEALGAGKPLWQRRWTAEERLRSRNRDDDDLTEALERLSRAPGVLLHARGTARRRYWLLERAPTLSADSSTGREASAEQESAAETRTPGIPTKPQGPMGRPVALRPRPFLRTVEEQGSSSAAAAVDRPADSGVRVPGRVSPSDIRKVLRDLGLSVEVDENVQEGPTVRRYRILVGPGTRVDTLRRRIEDISRELGCESTALLSNLPGERFVALDLPRYDREVVALAPALDLLPKDERASAMWLAVGVTPAGQSVTLDLADIPHLLIAGAPGAGKTVFVQAALLSLVLRLRPSDLEIVLIDPKGVDFVPFARLPHLRGGVITEPEEAIEILRDITANELPARTRVLQASGSPSLRELRGRSVGPRYLVVVIDEFAELVTVLGRAERAALESEVLRLAQRARAVGIHLMISTQRPSADLVTGAIKANFPSRISFRLPQKTDSQVILDQPGAESLMGAGDMLVMHTGRLQRLQGYFVPMNEIVTLVEARSAALRDLSEETADIDF